MTLKEELREAFQVNSKHDLVWAVFTLLRLNGARLNRICGISTQKLSLYYRGLSLTKEHKEVFNQLIEDSISVLEEFINTESSKELREYYEAVISVLEEV